MNCTLPAPAEYLANGEVGRPEHRGEQVAQPGIRRVTATTAAGRQRATQLRSPAGVGPWPGPGPAHSESMDRAKSSRAGPP